MSKPKKLVTPEIHWPAAPPGYKVTIADLKLLNPKVTGIELRAALARREAAREGVFVYPRTKARDSLIKQIQKEAKRIGKGNAIEKLRAGGRPAVDSMKTQELCVFLEDLKAQPDATPLADKPKAAKKRADYIDLDDLDEEDEGLPSAPDDEPKDAAAEQVGGDHYKQFTFQPAEIATRNGLSFLEGNVVKRMHRHSRGGKGLQDLQKAIHEIRLIAKWQYNEDI